MKGRCIYIYILFFCIPTVCMHQSPWEPRSGDPSVRHLHISFDVLGAIGGAPDLPWGKVMEGELTISSWLFFSKFWGGRFNHTSLEIVYLPSWKNRLNLPYIPSPWSEWIIIFNDMRRRRFNTFSMNDLRWVICPEATTWKVDGATPMYWFIIYSRTIRHLWGVASGVAPSTDSLPVCLRKTWIRNHMGVSKNRGTPKWMVNKGNPY